MNTQTQEALKMAIEALAEFEWIKHSKYQKAIKACKEALAQPTTTYEQPHGWMQQLVSETDGKKTIRYTFTKTRIGKNDIPIYFQDELEQPAPKNCTPLDEYIAEMEKDPEIKQLLDIAREDVKKWSTQPSLAPSWQGLSDDEIDKIYFKTFDTWSSEADVEFARAIESILKEKNHG